MANSGFKDCVFNTIKDVPSGKVVSYSKLAVICDKPGAVRKVGQMAHFGPSDLPWHRLVMASGAMASGFVPGGPKHQKELLLAEGVEFNKEKVIMSDFEI